MLIQHCWIRGKKYVSRNLHVRRKCISRGVAIFFGSFFFSWKTKKARGKYLNILIVLLECACALGYYVNTRFEYHFAWHFSLFYQIAIYFHGRVFACVCVWVQSSCIGCVRILFAENFSLCAYQVNTQSTARFICMFAFCTITPAASNNSNHYHRPQEQHRQH